MQRLGTKESYAMGGITLLAALFCLPAGAEHLISRRDQGPKQRLTASLTPDAGLTGKTVPHYGFNLDTRLPPPNGNDQYKFEQYEEYQGTFDLPADTASTPDYFDPAKLGEKGIDTVSKFVANLPEIFRKRVVAVTKSGSTHATDDLHPRFIMFNYEPSGRSVDNHPLDIIAVGTHPGDEHRNEVERISYDPRTRKFTFSAIDLSTKPPTNLDTADCARCHTEHLRPNFDPAHNWPSVIGVRERFGTFADDERKKMADMHASNEVARENFKMRDLAPENEQTPAAVLFYALFGPVHHYVSDNFVKNAQYQRNKTSVVKVLAGCEQEISELKGMAPAFFANKRAEIEKKAEKFKFTDNGEGKKLLEEDPVLKTEYTDQLTALVSLMKTNKDVDELGWLGKTSKVKEMYTHAFHKQDFDMLIGGLCERDETVKALLIRNGANPRNPCYDKRNASQQVCSEVDAPVLSAEVKDAKKELDTTKAEVCTRTQNGVSGQFYCVGEGVDQRIVFWNQDMGFYFCKNDPNAQVCPGQQQSLDKVAQDKILDSYVAMEKLRKSGAAFGTQGGFRSLAQRDLAVRAISKARPGQSLEALAEGRSPASPPQPVNLVRCAYQRAEANCVTLNGALRVVRFDAANGFHYCARSERNCPQSDRMPVSAPEREALLKRYETRVKEAERRNPASINQPAQQSMAQKIYYHYNGKGGKTPTPNPVPPTPNPTPNPNPNPTPNPTPNPMPQPNPPVRPTGGLEESRQAVAKLLGGKCYSCHKASAEPNEDAFAGYPMPANLNAIDANYVASLKGLAIAGGNALDRILDRVSDKGNPMPPGRYNAEIESTIRKWVELERANGK